MQAGLTGGGRTQTARAAKSQLFQVAQEDGHLQMSPLGHVQVKPRSRRRPGYIEHTVVAKGEGVGGGMEREVGVSRCKLLYIEWINNKVLLYSTRNYIQYPVINHNGKECLKNVYICLTESFCCTAEINTTL